MRMKKREIEVEYSTPKGMATLTDRSFAIHFRYDVRVFALNKIPTFKTFSTKAEAMQHIRENLL